MKSSFFQDIGHSVVRGTFFGISAVLTVAIMTIVYAATTSYPDLSTVGTGSGLTVTTWNNLVNYANKSVKQETEVLTVTGGKVGIGTVNPGVKLDVAGDIKASAGGTVGVTKINGTFGSATSNILNNTWTYVGDSITLTPGSWIIHYSTFYDHGNTVFAAATYNHPILSTNTNNTGNVSSGNLGACAQGYCPINQIYQIGVANTTTYYVVHYINGYGGDYVRIRSGWGNFYAIKVN